LRLRDLLFCVGFVVLLGRVFLNRVVTRARRLCGRVGNGHVRCDSANWVCVFAAAFAASCTSSTAPWTFADASPSALPLEANQFSAEVFRRP
jgi:hypothetical protein